MKSTKLKIILYKLFENVLGHNTIRSLYLSLCLQRYYRANCIFIHIPKAGGTSIASAVIGKRAGHFTASEIVNRIGEDKFNQFFSFSVTRDPYRRILSSYNFVKNGGGTEGSVRQEDYFKRKEFDSFESFILDWLPNQDLASTNLLFRPQYKFICDDKDNILVDYVGRLEELDIVRGILKKRLSKKISIGKKNTTDKVKSTQESLTPEIRETIFRLYQKDFEMFGYEK
ncbi:sulfotransferase family 2 domain-containing protein [Fodinibius salsisoli]|uniref:Sulfotransferase family 2 domain-containing protein n=1 Tax=Fodinibius salsisoli TaxID=2820877 RepID=A0ABT3PLE3_9BACT|nr:sulfotransferase family 2 domain-containing protein [Fodinibius salsisoli]MCW9706770.1 sulfotransferase family 2 domain-containing protein [Fodinibius salsisoli]